ncbi:prepilin peptidase [Cellulomonas iranensis]|uniref:Leader peptidase (Prepilin peptidase)/N-methyltransferase n=1 Tax=Cellulomonas iranensis TaxID=76862 RepID=A0ABU0GNX2_9CELL|nr:A24 family peptidase [Cellulomonas iranensis]MDQ0427067.1 leader peptidase (prepilin peptidase)/N-methyltransferase [Cellulomonas iranensis]
MTALLVVVAAVLGLAVGSFLNVVVWRVPRDESVVRPPSACPACGHPIRPRDNVPVVSWLLLRGRCRDCDAPISVRYPLVEATTSVLFALVVGWLGASWALPAFWYLAAVSVALFLIDVDVRRLPNAIVLPSYPLAFVLLALASANPGGPSDFSALLRAVLAGVALLVFYVVLRVVYPAGMGLGDVKLSGVLGLYLGWVGWSAVVVGAFAAFLLGGVYGVALVVLRRAGRKSTLPFGPWMLLGVAVGLVAGPAVAGWYVGLL